MREGRYSLQICFPIQLVSLLILPMFYLAVQKLFILMGSHLFILSFISLALGDMLKILLREISEISCVCSPLGFYGIITYI